MAFNLVFLIFFKKKCFFSCNFKKNSYHCLRHNDIRHGWMLKTTSKNDFLWLNLTVYQDCQEIIFKEFLSFAPAKSLCSSQRFFSNELDIPFYYTNESQLKSSKKIRERTFISLLQAWKRSNSQKNETESIFLLIFQTERSWKQ